ncbi:NAD(P)-binding protein [Paracoccus sp. (in: a-proteobacteria)]|uniref:NAD(P)-binding protein n=1 Tax=Paracoccus sp. TaxID=267 RepID=UPI002AFEDE6B|nr:NAD(P)-binding protein [Paracoccus sp. (in: a-proteobacteria)]
MSVWDAIVIGAGPAGIGGASLLAEGGARVLLIDEAPGPGGQIWRGIETAPPRPRSHPWPRLPGRSRGGGAAAGQRCFPCLLDRSLAG